MLNEAKRLYDLGFAVHWLRPNSKAPLNSKWTTGPRDKWPALEKAYRPGYGLGVRTGEASKLACGNYLANIDVDLKSGEKHHRVEALAELEKHFPGLMEKAPIIETGYGFRLVVKTAAPVESRKLGRSSELAVVFSPSDAAANRAQIAYVEKRIITEEKLKAGWRVKTAWEVELMSVGRQVVLPPTIHPDTKKPYRWSVSLAQRNIPLVSGAVQGKKSGAKPLAKNTTEFRPVEVDLISSRLSSRIVDMILNGKNVDDRSAACFSVALAMVKADYRDQEILSVLTDSSTYLGEAAYEHCKSTSRRSAAAWVSRYCLAKAKLELGVNKVFSALPLDEADQVPRLGAKEAKQQTAELTEASGGEEAWQGKLERDKGGTPKATLKNTLLVLRHVVGKVAFRYDELGDRCLYGMDGPWTGGKKAVGRIVEDADFVNIKTWLSQKYRFEPPVNTVYEAVTHIGRKNAFHPVIDELRALPAWDGVNRLDTWLSDYCAAEGDGEYLAQVMRKWLVASITRTFRPGAKFDWMPILEGAQGVGKSLFGEILFGEQYFNDWLPPMHDKDAASKLRGMRVHEFGELESLSRHEVETIKAFLTRKVDKYRPAYGRVNIEVPRQLVFFGTTNQRAYLKDPTGNRRFNPVVCGKVDFKALHKWRDQLWAEALFIYDNKLEATLELEGQAVIVAKELQAAKLVEDESALMSHEFEAFLAKETAKADSTFDKDRFSLVNLFSPGGPFDRWRPNARHFQFAAKALRQNHAEVRYIKGRKWWRLIEQQD